MSASSLSFLCQQKVDASCTDLPTQNLRMVASTNQRTQPLLTGIRPSSSQQLGERVSALPSHDLGYQVTQGGKCIHRSQHTRYILIKPYYIAIQFIGTCHHIITWQLRLFLKICIDSYFASHTWLSHSPCTLQVSTMQNMHS